MLLNRVRPIGLGFLTVAALAAFVAAPRAQAATPWHIVGKLSESCTCGVPCTCNFGQSPSPHSFCWAIASMTVDQGSYGDVDLSGLRFATAQGGKGFVFYVDSRANDQQFAAMKAISTEIWWKGAKANGVKSAKMVPPGFGLLAVKKADIEQTVGAKGNHVLIANAGRFDGDYIVGIDGKMPLQISNNWSIAITNNVKGKSRLLRYRDTFGNKFDTKDTNVNQGDFDWTDQTPVYFR